ncbi:MAG: LEPR-XLL domain-containing protein, partial [Verrucomicrobia bacterium]|nr:LEPR-XLL domain-containing protein [Verrucomicrobiota bacterium]
MKTKQSVDQYHLEALEPRIMLSSEGAEVLAPGAGAIVEALHAAPEPEAVALPMESMDAGFEVAASEWVDQELDGDFSTNAVPINVIEGDLKLIHVPDQENFFGENTYYLDTTNHIANFNTEAPRSLAGANIRIEGDIKGSGFEGGGTLYLNAGTGGNVTILGNIGTLHELGRLVIINANNVTINGNVIVGRFEQQDGQGNTTIGNSTARTFEVNDGNVEIKTRTEIRFNSSVLIDEGGDMILETTSTSTGAIILQSGVEIEDGDLQVVSTRNFTAHSDVNVGGALQQLDGLQETRFWGEVEAETINIRSNSNIRFHNFVRLQAGDMTLTSNNVKFQGLQNSILGATNTAGDLLSTLWIRPISETVNMDIGAPTGTASPMVFSTSDIAAIAPGFQSINFGYDVDADNHIRLAQATFRDPLNVYGGRITVSGPLQAETALTLNAAEQDIVVSGGPVRVINQQVDNVWGSSEIRFVAQEGDIRLNNSAVVEIENDSASSLDQGSAIHFQAPNGEIINPTVTTLSPTGLVNARDLTLQASGDIALVTEVKTLNAETFGDGNLHILENTGLHIQSAVTANGSMIFDAGGETRIDLARSQTDHADNTLTVDVFNGDLLVGEIDFGVAGNVTLNTEERILGLTGHLVTGGVLALSADQGIGLGADPLLILANVLRAENQLTGPVVIRQVQDRSQLRASIINGGTGPTHHISLFADGTDLFIDGDGVSSESASGIRIETTATLTFEADVTGSGGPLTLIAGGSATLGEDVTLSSGGGDLYFSANGNLVMDATAAIASLGGNLAVDMQGNIQLGRVDTRTVTGEDTFGPRSTWGNAALSATGWIRDQNDSPAVNIFARELRLQAVAGIGQLPSPTERTLELDAVTLAALTDGGVIALRALQSLTVGTVASFMPETVLETGFRSSENPTNTLSDVRNAAGGDILLTSAGALTLSSSADAVVTQGAGVIVLEADAMVLQGTVRSSGGNLSLQAVNDISLDASSNLLTLVEGSIAVRSSDGSLLASSASAIATGSGAIALSAFAEMTLGTVSTSGAAGLRAEQGTLRAADGDAARIVVSADTLTLVAENGLDGPSDFEEVFFKTQVNTLSLAGGEGDTFRIHNQGSLTLDSTSVSASLYSRLMAVSPLAFSADDVILAGAGDLSIVMDAGDGILAAGRAVSTGGNGAVLIQAGETFTMGTASRIETVNGPIELTANGDIAVARILSEDGDISVTSLTGRIVDADPGESAVDFATEGQLTLLAETGIGIDSEGDWQTLTVNLGTLRAESDRGGIFISSEASFTANGLVTAAADAPIVVSSAGTILLQGNADDVAVDAHGVLVIEAGGDLIQAVGTTIAAGGPVSLTAVGEMILASVATPGNLSLSADSVMGIEGTTGTEISANGLLLDEVGTVGSPLQRLRTALSALAGLITGGTLAFENDGDLTLGAFISVLTLQVRAAGSLALHSREQTGDRTRVSGAGDGVFAGIDGGLTVNALAESTLEVSDAPAVLWQVSGSQIWNGLFDLDGADLTLRADENVMLAADGISTTQNGNLLAEAGNEVWLLEDAVVNLGSGSALFRAGERARLDGQLITTGSAGVVAETEIFTTVSGGETRVTAANLILRAAQTVGSDALPLLTAVNGFSALSGAFGVYVNNTGDLHVTNLGFTVPSLQLNGGSLIAFSGHQGGVLTEQSGSIRVTTTGEMNVDESAAVIRAFPDSLFELSILANITGPEGNLLSVNFEVLRDGDDPIDASEAQDGSDLRTGMPVTTQYSGIDGVLKVFVRNGQSTLQEIVDAINADAGFPGTALLANGPFDGSTVLNLTPAAETQFFAAGGRNAGVVSQISERFAGGLEPISAVADVVVPGQVYTLRFTALNPGEAANEFQVLILDDGPGGRLTTGADQAEVEWDETAGLLRVWVNFGITTVGTLLTAVENANQTDSVPFAAALAGFSTPGNLSDTLGDAPLTLTSNLFSSAILRPNGPNNDIQITASGPGPIFNGISTRFVDDGLTPELGVRIAFNGVANVLTIFIQSGITTANQVITAVNADGLFTAVLVPEASAPNNGSGVIQAHRFLLTGGAFEVNASAVLRMEGSNNDLVITANEQGDDPNGIEVRFVRDNALLPGQAAANYNATTRVLEIRVDPGFTNPLAVLEAVNASSAPLTAAFLGEQTGSGAIRIEAYPVTAGGSGAVPVGTFVAEGENNDFDLEADSDAPSLQGIRVFLIDNGEITDGTATAVYLSGPKHLVVNLQSGVTPMSAVLAAINAAENNIPVTATAAEGNDGTGVYHLNPAGFLGGADPVRAVKTTILPNGLEIILETEIDGVIMNGIQVVYVQDSALPSGTAFAEFFEADGVRLLTVRVADDTTQVQAVQDALDSAELPFLVLNLNDIATEALGPLAVAPEGHIHLVSGGDLRLSGRILTEAGSVEIETEVNGDLIFENETTRIVAMTNVDILLAGSFVNEGSLENPLIRNIRAGLLRIETGTRTTLSSEAVHLLSRGDIEITGAGFATDDQPVELLADGNITVDGVIDSGTGSIVMDAGDGVILTGDGELSGGDITVDAVNIIQLDGLIAAAGDSDVIVTSAEGDILMGGDSAVTTVSGQVLFTAPGDIGVTSISSTDSGTIELTAGGAILDTHASDGLNLSTAGLVLLTAQTGIGAVGAGDLKTEVGTLRLRNLGEEGDIVITQTDGTLTVTEITQAADAGGEGWVILNVQNGGLILDGPVDLAGDGSLRAVASGDLGVQGAVTLQGGTVTMQSGLNLALQANLTSGGGDASLVSGGQLTMGAATTLNAGGGDVLLSAQNSVFLSQILSPGAGVRILSQAGSVLRAAVDGRTNVISQILQLRAASAVGSLASVDDALITDVDVLNAVALDGPLALRNLSDVSVESSTVDVTFALDDKSFDDQASTESQLMTRSGNAALRIQGNLSVLAFPGTDPTLSIDGNLHLNVDGSLTVSGAGEILSGSAQIEVGQNAVFSAELSVSGGTLLLNTGGAFSQTAASVITVEDANAVITSGGAMTVSRIDTGSGDLALTAGGALTRAASAPSVQLSTTALRLNSGVGIGAVGAPIALSAATLTAAAPGSVHLHSAGDVAVTSVEVSADEVSVLGATDPADLQTETAQAEIRSTNGGNVLVSVAGRLELFDGNNNGRAVQTVAGGHIFLQAAHLDVYADLQSADGHITLSVSQLATWFAQAESEPGFGDGFVGRALTNAGHIHVTGGTGILMQDGSVIRSTAGNVRLVTTGTNRHITLARVEATNGLVSLNSSGMILDGGDTDTDVIADRLHMVSGTGVGVLGGAYNPIDVQVNRLAALVSSGVFAVSEASAIELGAVSGSVSAVNLSGVVVNQNVAIRDGIQNFGSGGVSLTAVGSITVLSDGTVDPGVRSTGSGNIHLAATGAGSQIALLDNVITGTGHVTLRASGMISLAEGVLVQTNGTGTLSVISEVSGILQAAGATFASQNGDIVLEAELSVALSGITTSAGVSVRSQSGAVLDNDPARINVTAARLRLEAVSIATGVNPLNIQVNQLSARASDGGVYLREETGVTVTSVSAQSSVVGADGLTIVTPVAAQSGLFAGGLSGDLVLRAVNGNLTVNAANPVEVEGFGNLLLESSANLVLTSEVTAERGTVTLRSGGNFTLAAGLLVSTGLEGQIHVLSEGALTTGINSRFVAEEGHVLLAAAQNVVLGGILTQGSASIGSMTGVILGAGSTDFDVEVEADELILVAPLGGVGGLLPAAVQIFRTRVNRIAAVGGAAGLNVVNAIALEVGEVEMTVSLVIPTGSLAAPVTDSLAGFVTQSGNGPLVLQTLAGDLTVNQTVISHGAGNLRLDAADRLIVNAAVSSAEGHLTLRAANDLLFGAAGSATVSLPGTLLLRSDNGAVTLAAASVLTAVDSALRIEAHSTITLGVVSASEVSLISHTGGVLRSAGSLRNITADRLRIESETSIGAPSALLTADVAVLSLHSRSGSVYVSNFGDVLIGGVELAVQEVNLSAGTAPVADPLQAGLSGGLNGNLVLVSETGSVTVDADSPVLAQGTGNIRLDAAAGMNLLSAVTSSGGHITLLAGNGLTLAETLSIATSGSGGVYVDAGTGALTLPAAGGISAPGGPVYLRADGDVLLGFVAGGNILARSENGSLIRVGNEPVTLISAAGLSLRAGQHIGSAANPILTQTATLSARSADGMYVTEATGVIVTQVQFPVIRVGTSGAGTTQNPASQADLQTTADGNIVLITLNGNITLNDGNSNQTAVSAAGTGSILLQASGNLTANANAGLSSVSGNIALHAQGNLSLAVLTVQSSAGGDLSLAAAGTLSMAGQTQVNTSGNIRVRAGSDVNLGNLSAAAVSVVSENSLITNTLGTTRNITANQVRLQAQGNIGVSARRISISAGTLSARSETAGLFLNELNDVTFGQVAVTVTELTAAGTTTTRTDGPQNGLSTGTNGTVNLTAGGTVSSAESTGDVNAGGSGVVRIVANAFDLEGDVLSGTGLIALRSLAGDLVFSGVIATEGDVSLRSAGMISGGRVEAATARITAESSVGSLFNLLELDVNRLAAESATGGVYLHGRSDVTLATVSVDALPDLTALTAATEIVFFSDAGIFTETSTADFTAPDVLIHLSGSAGTALSPLKVQTNTLAARSENGDLFLVSLEDLTIGIVYILAGLTAANGSVYLGVFGSLTMNNDVAAAEDVSLYAQLGVVMDATAQILGDRIRIASPADLDLALVSGNLISLVTDTALLSGDLQGGALRIQSEQDIGGALSPVNIDVNELSAASIQGSVYLTAAGSTALATVGFTIPVFDPDSVTFVPESDAQQHGVSAAGDIELITLTGRWLDGGDTDDDIRTATGTVTLTGAGGLGTTGAGAL